MKTRIIAAYLIREGIDEIGDRDVDLDEFQEVEVPSIAEGCKLIAKNDLHGNGIGRIIIEKKVKYGWEDLETHYVEEGTVYRTEYW